MELQSDPTEKLEASFVTAYCQTAVPKMTGVRKLQQLGNMLQPVL